MRKICLLIMSLQLFFSCGKNVQEIFVDELPPIYPDYIDVTIPCNIAPLNFILRSHSYIPQPPSKGELNIPLPPSKGELVSVVLQCSSQTLRFKGKGKIRFPLKQWKKLLLEETGKSISVTVKVKTNGVLLTYRPFEWHISADSIDPYLTYRLIEPGYEVWNKVQLCERNIENFSTRVFADNNLHESACINCHITANQNPNISFFHLRGEKGGTILNNNGKLRKINTRTKDMFAAATYGNFHPSGRYAVFSSNIVIPQFHTISPVRLEVFDTSSDLHVIDFDSNRIFSSPLISGSDRLETFPCFSADGKKIYFCVAPALSLPEEINRLKYSLCAINFDDEKGILGNRIDTLIDMSSDEAKSVSFPRMSPDGRFLLYCVSDYGTFPIWHPETDLAMMDMQTRESIVMDIVNSDNSDTYHSWSSNSRWFVFASKRDDGWYGKPYFAYVDRDGKVHKPFVLPQNDPHFYDYNFKSFNIPELMTGKLPFSVADIEKIYLKGKTESID